jgi:bifunctional UDP-N-acetylglucosamine pyrophosphorylase/glucosamine-1-phosphate N-acetyltransferase
MTNLQAIILAAGAGTRMKSELPKVLHPICGRPMVAYALDLVAAAGVRQPIVVLGHGADQVKAVLPKEVRVVIQHKPLGTGDAVLSAKKFLTGGSGNVLVLYADTPLLRRTTVQRMIESHGKHAATCTLLSAHLADPSSYGRIVRDEHGRVTAIVEEAEANAAQRAIREINIGPLVCKAQALMDALSTVKPAASSKELYLTHLISFVAAQEGAKIQVEKVQEISEAMGINSRIELSRAISIIRQRIVDSHLRQSGVTIEDPSTTYIDQGVTIGHDTVIRPCTVIETGVSIGRRCAIGPFAHLRSGVSVGDDVKVGNFAEMVRAKVGNRVRIGHVSYLGDAQIDDDVNIGAGTITANYDGKDKHPTHIGKGAFIGSDTVLVAPVKVGPGGVTGAGCVIPKGQDVPARGVVVGVPARSLNGASKPQAPESNARAAAAKRPKPAARKQAKKKPAVRRAKVLARARRK